MSVLCEENFNGGHSLQTSQSFSLIIIIIIIIIAFKGAFRNFFTISSQRRELSPTHTLKWPGRNRVQITCNTSNTYHMQVSCYVPFGTKGQLSC